MAKYSSYITFSPYPTTEFPMGALELDVDLLTRICGIQGRSGKELNMIEFLEKELRSWGLSPLRDKKDNMYIVKGEAESYPCMIAHLDTVHDFCETYQVFQDGPVLFAYNRTSGKTTGIGGDDRVGIAIAMQLLKTLPNMKVAFFREEEIGGANGSGQANMPFFKDTNLVLQCDRQGSQDWVQKAAGTHLATDEFIEAIKPLLEARSYKSILTGGFTDVANLKQNGLGVCAANMSCGYYRPHSSEETIFLPAMQNTLNLCYEVFSLLGNVRQPHTYVPYKASTSTYSGKNGAYRQHFVPSGINNWFCEMDESAPLGQRKWEWVKKIGGVVVAGPCKYQECEALDLKYQAAVAAEKAKEQVMLVKQKKKIISAWVKKEGSWILDRPRKCWVKILREDPLDLTDPGWIVAYADTLLDIPGEEREFQNEFGKDLLEGVMTVKEVIAYIQLQEEERLLEEHEEEEKKAAQLQLFAAGEGGTEDAEVEAERRAFSYEKDDDNDDEYHFPVGKPNLTTYDRKNLACPHCDSQDERLVQPWNENAFYCHDCGTWSDDKATEDYKQEPHTPLSYASTILAGDNIATD